MRHLAALRMHGEILVNKKSGNDEKSVLALSQIARPCSGKSVIRAGKILADPSVDRNSTKFKSAMDISSYWRFSHEVPLEKAISIVEKVVLKEDPSSLQAKRLKRTDSIIKKLQRLSNVQLKTMQDIGGCRFVVSSNKVLRRIVARLKKVPEFKNNDGRYRIKDYIKVPKDDGYRSFHLVGKFQDENGDKKKIEVQLRTRKQHYWATAVEIIDLFTGQALKLDDGIEEWRNFLNLVSWQISLVESIASFDNLNQVEQQNRYIQKLNITGEEAVNKLLETQALCKKLKVVEKLTGFSVALKVVDDHMINSPATEYILPQIDTEKAQLSYKLFNDADSQRAERLYGKKEKFFLSNPNIVIALVSTTAVGGIREAYPNYFADSSEFVKLLHLVNSIKVKSPRAQTSIPWLKSGSRRK